MCVIIHSFCPKCDKNTRTGIIDCEPAKAGQRCGDIRVRQDHYEDDMCDKCYRKSQTLKDKAKHYAKKITRGSSSKAISSEMAVQNTSLADGLSPQRLSSAGLLSCPGGRSECFKETPLPRTICYLKNFSKDWLCVGERLVTSQPSH
ncbi:hypothetical protein ACHAQJ_000883 [Trichoderma viride]